MKALIVYGTRYGATAGTSEEIAKVLRDEGFITALFPLFMFSPNFLDAI